MITGFFLHSHALWPQNHERLPHTPAVLTTAVPTATATTYDPHARLHAL